MINVTRKSCVLAVGALFALVNPSAQASLTKGVIIGATGFVAAYTAWKARQPKPTKMVRVWYKLEERDPNGTLADVKEHGLTVPTGRGEYFKYYDFWVLEADGSISSLLSQGSSLLSPGPCDIGFDVDAKQTKVRNRRLKDVKNESAYRDSEQLLEEYMTKKVQADRMKKNPPDRVLQHPVTAEPYRAPYQRMACTAEPYRAPYQSMAWEEFGCGCSNYYAEVIIGKQSIDPEDLHFYDEQGNETK